jgi:hypothetical protein
MPMKFKHLTALAALTAAALSSLPAQAALVASDSTFGTFDDSRGTRTLSIGSGGTILDVNIAIDFAKCDNPAAQPGDARCPSQSESYLGETFFYLISPTGTRVDLVWTYSTLAAGAEGGSTKADGTYQPFDVPGSRVQVVFDDEAAAAVGPAMLTGSFRPEESLSAFDGESALGNWTLGMGDSVGADPLSYFSATLTIDVGGVVPAPAPLALLGAGLLAAGALRRRTAR